MATIGLVPMAGRPFHLGHDCLIRIASRENDAVRVFTSFGDRGSISGAGMARVWEELIVPTLPANVSVEFVTSPVGSVYKVLGDADAAGSVDRHSVYSDAVDCERNYATLGRYAGRMLNAGLIVLRGVPRSETVEVSGTQMRAWFDSGDRRSFVSMVPPGVGGDAMWDILKGTPVVARKKASRRGA